MTDPDDWKAVQRTLIGHDASIRRLSDDMASVKSELRSLDTAVSAGFSDLGAKFEKMSAAETARPRIDPHQWMQSMLAGAILFSMIVAGIIWVTTQQFSGIIAKQESTNTAVQDTLNRLADRVGWYPTTKREN